MSNPQQNAAPGTLIAKTGARPTPNLINRNSLTTFLVLGTFAAILTGKILTAPKERESEQWMDESNHQSRL